MSVVKKTKNLVVFMSLFAAVNVSGYPQESAPSTAIAQKTDNISVRELMQLAKEALAQEKFASAANYYVRLASIDTLNVNHHYNAACAFAMDGQRDSAFTWLDKSIKAGYLDLEHLKKDTDLVSLHKDGRWQVLLDTLNEKRKKDARLWDSDVWKIPYSDQLSEDQRLAGLAKLWSEVKYGFVFTESLKELDWDALFFQYLPKVKAATTTEQYYRLLISMAAMLKDGHTRVIPPKELIDQSFAMPLLRASLIEDRVILTEVADELLRTQGLAVGMEVLQVNGEPVKQYLQQYIAPFISASTPQDMQRRLYVSQFLMGPLNERIELSVQDQHGKKAKYLVPRVDTKKRSELMPALPAFSWSMLDNNIAYVALNSFGTDAAAREYLSAFPQIAKAKAIIFDVRKNGGGNGSVGYRILSTLTNQPFEVGASSTRDYKPAIRAWGRTEPAFKFETRKIPADAQLHFAGKVVVLSAAQTYSAAEDFLVAFDLMQRGMIIGEASGGSTGQPLLINLPGGGVATIVSKHDTYPDGKAFVGVGVQVGRRVLHNLKDFRANRDTVLEAAIAELK